MANGSTTCEDGVNITHTCSVCGSSYISLEYVHVTYVKEYYDFSEYVDGAYFCVYSCACGYDGGVDWGFPMTDSGAIESNTDSDGVEHTVTTYTSSENTSIVYVKDTYSKEADGVTTYYNDYTLKNGDTVITSGTCSWH